MQRDEPGGQAAHACDRASWPSFLFYTWLNPLVESGANRQLHLEDVPPLAEAEDVAAASRKLCLQIEAEQRAGQEHAQIRAVVKTFWTELSSILALQILGFAFSLLSPLLLQKVLVFQEAQNSNAKLDQRTVTTGLIAVAGMVVFGLFSLLFNSQANFYRARVDVRLYSALKGAVLMRGLQRGSTKGQDPSEGPLNAYNVLSFDVGPNIQIIWICMGLLQFPVELFMALAALYSQVAWAIFPGLLVIILAKTIIFLCMYADGHLRELLLQAKDDRLDLCQETFLAIRTLQMLAWTGPLQERILAARDRELKYQRNRLWLRKMSAALDTCLVFLVTLVTLSYFCERNGSNLKASVALPVVSLISSLIGPFSRIPNYTNEYLIWKSAYQRVNRFMGLGLKSFTGQQSEPGGGRGANVIACFSRCSLSWETSPPAAFCGESDSFEDDIEGSRQWLLRDSRLHCELQGLDLEIRDQELLCVVGAPGQGKSSLLAALLGQMHVEEGALTSPGLVCGRAATASSLPENMADGAVRRQLEVREGVPFAAQVPALFAGTVRENVVFGLRYEANLYQQVLAASALTEDLQLLPSGDLTTIISGGSNLSGGQRARVALARAFYRAHLTKAPMLLLDDPFCALDKQVATEICSSVFAKPNGLLSRCAVVVATADPWWLTLLDGASVRVAVLRIGCLVAEGHLHALKDRSDLPELSACKSRPAMAFQPQRPQEPPKDSNWNPQDEETLDESLHQESSKLLTKAAKALRSAQTQTLEPSNSMQESREDGHVRWATYAYYFSAAGIFTLSILALSLVGIMVLQNLCNLWLAYWTTDQAEKSRNFMYPFMKQWGDATNLNLLWMYAGLVLCYFLANIAGHGLEIITGMSAAGSIFKDSLAGTLQRPIQWWDANPTGRVVNRFSSDVAVMDDSVTNIMGVIFGAVLYFIGHVFVLGLANPASMALVPLTAMLIEHFAKYYRVSIREIQRIYLTGLSVVYQDMTEAAQNRTTLYAFGSVERSLALNLQGLDNLQRTAFTKTCIGFWVGLRMSLAGFLLSVFAQLHPVLQYFGVLNPQSAALVGFSITYSGELVGIIQQFVMNFSDLEMQLISIERLRDFAEREDKTAFPLHPSLRASSQEALQGLCLSSVEVTYREGIRPALYGISMRFPAGEVAIIMGRTGAGKTSLLLSIMQLVPYKGTIQVDGKNLREVPGEQVRSSLVTIVPQQPVLFQGTLRFNLDPTNVATPAAMFSALQSAGLQSLSTETGLDLKIAGTAGNDGSTGPALSLGQRQQLCAARALLRRPRVALLDECTSAMPQDRALDTAQTLLSHLKSLGSAVLFVTHKEELTCLGNRLITISEGRIAEDRRLPVETSC